MDFANKKFKVGGESIACVSYFGFPEKMDKEAPAARERIEKELLDR
jgi:myo-inositol catabolism protein IolH